MLLRIPIMIKWISKVFRPEDANGMVTEIKRFLGEK